MIAYLIDFAIVAAIVVGTTATNGVIGHGIGMALGGKDKPKYVLQSQRMQEGFKFVGGKNNRH